MSHIPQAAELYSDAVAAGKIRDIIGAAGMAGRREAIGALLWRALHGGDRSVVASLRVELFAQVEKIAVNKRWPAAAREQAKPLAALVLRWYLSNKCPTCTGRRYQPVPGVDRVLSAMPCPMCRGSGRTDIEAMVETSLASRAKEIAILLDLAEQRMADKVRRARRNHAD